MADERWVDSKGRLQVRKTTSAEEAEDAAEKLKPFTAGEAAKVPFKLPKQNQGESASAYAERVRQARAKWKADQEAVEGQREALKKPSGG